MKFADATQEDAEAIAALHAAAAESLTRRFGAGRWSGAPALRRVEDASPFVRIRVGRERGRVVSALRLQTKKPWAIDVAYFTPVRRAIYLTDMVVAAAKWGKGLGRAALEDARHVAAAWPADAIKLDAYDAAAGAGPFYAKCGYIERGRVVYRKSPLIYYEQLL